MSTYLISRPHQSYGDQAYFTQKMDEAETFIAQSIQEAVTAKKDLTVLFHTLLAHLGKVRHGIDQHAHPEAESRFGVRRDLNPHGWVPFYLTPLGTPYNEYGDKLLQVLQKSLSTMTHTSKEFQQTELTVKEEPCLGRAFSTHIEVLIGEKVKEWALPLTFDEFEKYCHLCGIPSFRLVGLSPFAHFEKLSANLEAMKTLKTKSLNDYKRLRTALAIKKLREHFPEPKKSDWVVVTLRMQIGNQMVALSQYVTWMYRDFREDPVEHMTGHSVVSIYHQDPLLIGLLLDDVAKIFKEAVEWNRENLTALKDRLILFEQELAHANPNFRGNAAIIERFVSGIYRSHGFKVIYNQKRMSNLEALTTSLSTFKRNYDDILTLEPIH